MEQMAYLAQRYLLLWVDIIPDIELAERTNKGLNWVEALASLILILSQHQSTTSYTHYRAPKRISHNAAIIHPSLKMKNCSSNKIERRITISYWDILKVWVVLLYLVWCDPWTDPSHHQKGFHRCISSSHRLYSSTSRRCGATGRRSPLDSLWSFLSRSHTAPN